MSNYAARFSFISVTALFLSVAATSGDAMCASNSSKQTQNHQMHSVTILSREPFQFVSPQQNDKQWYEKGPWPLIGAVVTVTLTNTVALGLVFLQASRSFNLSIKQRDVINYSTSLNEFYEPLLTLIDVNNQIYLRSGPPSFPKDDEIGRNAAGLVWKEMKQHILSNNSQIANIVKTRTHLLNQGDSIDRYQDLLIHVAMYETLQKIRTDLYKRGFTFPAASRAHILQYRDATKAAYDIACGKKQ